MMTDLLSVIAKEFTLILLFIVILGYLLPCGHSYYLYFVRMDEGKAKRRIQERRPTNESIRREIKMSIQSMLIFAVMGTGLFQMYKAGMTSIYWDTFAYPWYYIPISFILCFVIQDTVFYWTHRFMHWRPVFKYIHSGHHKSVSPSPWAIFAFQPMEAVIQFTTLSLIIIFVPLKPIVLMLYMSYDSMINIAGHTGHEMMPSWMARHWFFKGFNNVTNHDNHHTNMRYNFGAFFNVWDRLMGTFLDSGPDEQVQKVLYIPKQDLNPGSISTHAE
jgi:Delta7-sterol 5-desaturase